MGEIKKIRIGNDIRLAVDLRQYIGGRPLREREVFNPDDPKFESLDSNPFVNKVTEVYYPNQYQEAEVSEAVHKFKTEVAIRGVKAYLINTSKEKEWEDRLHKETKFIARYPVEPCCGPFHANPYNICGCGYPCWKAYPYNYCMAPYHGYGVNPKWHDIYHKLPVKTDFEFFAPVMMTEDQNVVEVSFPAEAQRFTGVYKLILVVKAYAPGFNVTNTKTITVDVPDVFELVKSTDEGIDTGIVVNTNLVQDVLTNGGEYDIDNYNDIYVERGSTLGNNIILNRTDGNPVNVDVSELTGWYEGD